MQKKFLHLFIVSWTCPFDLALSNISVSRDRNWKGEMMTEIDKLCMRYELDLLTISPSSNTIAKLLKWRFTFRKIDGFLSGISISLSNTTLQANNVDCFDSEICQLPCPWCEIFWANMNYLNVVFQKNPPNHHWFWVHYSIWLIFAPNECDKSAQV